MTLLWDRVWSLDVPSKAKHLLWRVCDDLLPDYKIIRKKVMTADEVCFHLDGQDPRVTHTLLKCEYARLVWFACPLGLKVDAIIFDSLSELVSNLCNEWDDYTLAMWAMVAWGIWFNRHIRCQGKQGFDPLDLVQKVMKEFYQFQKLDPNVKSVDKQYVQEASWVAPPRGWVKINCHMAHMSRFNTKGIGFGCVIRDDKGHVLGSFTNRLNSRPTKNPQEILVYESLLFGLDMGFRNIILETDCLPTVRKLQSMSWETSEFAVFLEQSRSLSPEDYELFVYNVKLDHNVLANGVARCAIEVDDFMVWIDDLPPGVTNTDSA